MHIGRHLVWALLSLSAAGLPLSGQAQELIDRRQKHDGRVEQAGVSLDQAVEMAQRHFRAKAVSAEGKVWTVRVDAESGAMH
jgi:hypothetical protein